MTTGIADPAAAGVAQPPPTRSKRDWAKVLSLGYIEDRNGKRRQVNWYVFTVLGVLLPAFALFALYRIIAGAVSVATSSPMGGHQILTGHVLGGLWTFTVGLYHMSTATVPLGLWVLTFILFKATNLAISIYYHRGLTHRGVKFRKGTELVMSSLAMMAWQGAPMDWVTDHRRHHQNADVVGEDPHSPWEYPGWRGLLWAQWVWLFFKIERPPANQRPRDLRANGIVMWQSRWGFPIFAALSLIIPLAFYGWNGVLIAGLLRLTAHLTLTGFINSVCHMWGTRARDSLGREYVSDDSRNNLFVAAISDGEGNHSGHHADPGSPQHGWKAELEREAIRAGIEPDRRWLPDFSWQVIRTLARLRLLTIMQSPPRKIEFNNRQRMPNPSLRAVHSADEFTSRGGRRAARHDRELTPTDA